ncbi:MAG: hypothetical protein A2958_02780 [Candidatus Levybacteria bacterium RIFCSPLOWO2_01_FULL_38_13]|nr:MAG: hypothetical protein A2629_03195 [Candidatus Levybacteria bacterium RIFCSPHIGHO2_01_FULL_41_15]OGH35262.1 MAG: hypothetical protein A2958_02780 [Candidatus Levybacteria bacterium RIFCSPLOWO2_01_FULL_38_13]
MREKVNIDIETIRIIYSKYRSHLVYITVLIVCLILSLGFILPRVLDLGSINKKRQEETQKLRTLKGNMETLLSQDDSSLDNDLQALLSALPETKDYDGILSAISDAAGKSGVSLSDYQLQIGKISEITERTQGYPSLRLILNLKTNLSGTQKFLRELSKTLPLSNVSDVVHEGNSASVTTLFYYKPFSPFQPKEDEKLVNLSKKEQNLVSKISEWNRPIVALLEVSSPSSPSASSPF